MQTLDMPTEQFGIFCQLLCQSNKPTNKQKNKQISLPPAEPGTFPKVTRQSEFPMDSVFLGLHDTPYPIPYRKVLSDIYTDIDIDKDTDM